MDNEKKFFEDMAKLASSTFGTFAGMKQEFDQFIKQKCEHYFSKMQLVTREEFEVVRDMAVKAREEQAGLLARIECLEQKLAAKEAKSAKKVAAGTTQSEGDEHA